MDKRKMFMYGSSAVLFGMYWLLFATLSNWWVGLLTATFLFWLQRAVRRALDKVKIQ